MLKGSNPFVIEGYKRYNINLLSILLSILLITFTFILPSTSLPQLPIKLAILPFKIYSAQDLGYLKQGISEMLKSRLSWEEHILVIEAPKDVVKETKSIREVGKVLNVDYVLSGSLTIFGGSASIDLRLINIEDGKTTPFFGQYNNLDEVVPNIGKLAEKVVEKLIPSEVSEEKEVAEPTEVLEEKPEISEKAIHRPKLKRRGTTLRVTFFTDVLKPKSPQTYHLFLSDKPQVKGKDPIIDEEDIEIGDATFPEYRRAGKIEKQGLDLGKVSVKEKTSFVFDVTDFINDHPSKRYFLAVKKEEADYFLAMEVWFKKGINSSDKIRLAFQTGILGGLFDQKLHTKADTLEFSVGSPE
ncbi:MAG: hypothetical protein AMJ45_03205 [Syntrophobacter sp. DG_60]|nr:MAG: hypothetical protein AMJ45_03205 [Syntrophobacter sp. DG_60]